MSPVTDKRMKIIDKVIKLLALAEGSSFDEERESAKRFAAELMAKHNVEIGEIKQEEFVIENVDTGKKLQDKVESTLMNTIARFCGIKLYTNGSTVWRAGRVKNAAWILVGRTADIESARYMFDIIKNQLESALTDHRKAKGLKYTEMTLKVKNDFRRGYVYAVQNKIYDLIHMQNNKIQEWGLVVVSSSDLAKQWYENQHKTTTSKSRANSYSGAGYAAGQNCSIHKGVNQSSSGRLQIGA